MEVYGNWNCSFLRILIRNSKEQVSASLLPCFPPNTTNVRIDFRSGQLLEGCEINGSLLSHTLGVTLKLMENSKMYLNLDISFSKDFGYILVSTHNFEFQDTPIWEKGNVFSNITYHMRVPQKRGATHSSQIKVATLTSSFVIYKSYKIQ